MSAEILADVLKIPLKILPALYTEGLIAAPTPLIEQIYREISGTHCPILLTHMEVTNSLQRDYTSRKGLKNPNYTFVNRAEGLLLGDTIIKI